MFSWRTLLVLAALMAALVACQPMSTHIDNETFNLTDDVTFTAGDFGDVPAYPAAGQTTETDPTLNAIVRIVSLAAAESEWKHYVSGDDHAAVIDWYVATLPDEGWRTAETEVVQIVVAGDDCVFVRRDDPTAMLHILALSNPGGTGETEILVGRLRALEDEE